MDRVHIDASRTVLFLTVCEAIWNYRQCHLPEEEAEILSLAVENILPDPDEAEFYATSSQLMETIQSLIRLPVDLLSIKMDLAQAFTKYKDIIFPFHKKYDDFMGTPITWEKDCLRGLIPWKESLEMHIIHWAAYLGVTPVVELILEIDPDQAKKLIVVPTYVENVESYHPDPWDLTPRCTPLHILVKTCYDQERQLPMIQRLCEIFPEALTIADREGNLPLHLASLSKPLEVFKFILQQYPKAASVQNKFGKYPLNISSSEEWRDTSEEKQCLLIEACPKALTHRPSSKCDESNMLHIHNMLNPSLHLHNHYQRAFNVSTIKKVFEYGKMFKLFDPNTIHGLFEVVHFDVEMLISDEACNPDEPPFDPDDYDSDHNYLGSFDPNAEYDYEIELWRQYFQAPFTAKIIRTTTLELLLATYHTIGRSLKYEEGWNEVVEVFQEAIRGTPMLQSAFGRVQDDLLPHIIDKFDISHFAKIQDNSGQFPLHVASAFGLKWSNGLDKIFNAHAEASKIQDASGRFPLHMAAASNLEWSNGLDEILNAHTDAVKIQDASGRCPIHIASASSLKWSNGLDKIFDAHPAAIETCDPTTGLYPFMLAATGESYDVDSIFLLFVNQPDVIESLYDPVISIISSLS